MKKLLAAFLAIACILLSSSCMKEDHQVRFKNNYALAIHNVQIGDATFGTVRSGVTSGYKNITAGDFRISGTADNGAPLTGSGTISGRGKHKWTITLTNAGTVAMGEDK